MFCNECGEGNPEDANYCNKCGNSLVIYEFSINYFIKQNKDLLVCLGVFGALTIYLKQISLYSCNQSVSSINSGFGNFCYLDFGVAASLIIFLVLGFSVFVKLLGIYDEGPRPFVFNYGNIVRIILIIPFAALFISIFYFITLNLSAPSQFILIFIISFLGCLFFFGILKLFSSLTKKWYYHWIGCVILFVTLLFAGGVALYIKNIYLLGFVTIFNVFNLLFIIGYPVRVFVTYRHQNRSNIRDSVRIALDQLQKRNK